MYFNNKVVWSPVEIEHLIKHKEDTPVNQLSQELAKSRAAIQKKLAELDGKTSSITKGKRSYIGKRPDLGISLRSTWEADACRYFNHMGWKWFYEPQTFFFTKEKRGVISYLPDFYLPEQDIYIELKGFLDSRGRSAIHKFRKYYPVEYSKLRAITGSAGTKATKFFTEMNVPVILYMNELNRQYKSVIPFWNDRYDAQDTQKKTLS